jgi:hypothetical protein
MGSSAMERWDGFGSTMERWDGFGLVMGGAIGFLMGGVMGGAIGKWAVAEWSGGTE